MSDTKINIRINHLVVRGGYGTQRATIATAVTQELQRLIAAQGLPPHWREGRPLRLPARIGATGTQSNRLGESIARAIYRGGK